jgi:hypothetical protein
MSGVTRRSTGQWKRWGGPPARLAACALGAAAAVALVIVGAVVAVLFTVAVASLRGARAGAGTASARPGREADHLRHAGTASRMRTKALQRAAADEAAR